MLEEGDQDDPVVDPIDEKISQRQETGKEGLARSKEPSKF